MKVYLIKTLQNQGQNSSINLSILDEVMLSKLKRVIKKDEFSVTEFKLNTLTLKNTCSNCLSPLYVNINDITTEYKCDNCGIISYAQLSLMKK